MITDGIYPWDDFDEIDEGQSSWSGSYNFSNSMPCGDESSGEEVSHLIHLFTAFKNECERSRVKEREEPRQSTKNPTHLQRDQETFLVDAFVPAPIPSPSKNYNTKSLLSILIENSANNTDHTPSDANDSTNYWEFDDTSSRISTSSTNLTDTPYLTVGDLLNAVSDYDRLGFLKLCKRHDVTPSLTNNLRLYATEDDGSIMDDLPELSMTTVLHKIGLTDFVVVDYTSKIIMHIHIELFPFPDNSNTTQIISSSIEQNYTIMYRPIGSKLWRSSEDISGNSRHSGGIRTPSTQSTCVTQSTGDFTNEYYNSENESECDDYNMMQRNRNTTSTSTSSAITRYNGLFLDFASDSIDGNAEVEDIRYLPSTSIPHNNSNRNRSSCLIC